VIILKYFTTRSSMLNRMATMNSSKQYSVTKTAIFTLSLAYEVTQKLCTNK